MKAVDMPCGGCGQCRVCGHAKRIAKHLAKRRHRIRQHRPRFVAVVRVVSGEIVKLTSSLSLAAAAWAPGTQWGGGDTPALSRRAAICAALAAEVKAHA